MNTPTHILLGAALFARRSDPSRNTAAVLGSLAPDLSLYLLAGVSLFVLNIPGQVVFGELYDSPAWKQVFAIDNSFIVWGALLGLALWRGWRAIAVLCGAALIHVATDFPLHHDDGRPHFWPLTWWEFQSPVSYWDGHHHAGIAAPVLLALAAICTITLLRRFPHWAPRAAFLILFGLDLWVARQWLLFF